VLLGCAAVRPSPLGAYDLAEAAFDVTGIHLPVQMDSRNVYYEPAASQGPNALKMFRHREGPRQTYLNRIQTGSLSGGLNKPNLFNVNHPTLPVTVSLRPGWIENLRAFPDNELILDSKGKCLFTWLFRFGSPNRNGTTAAMAQHLNNGTLVLRSDITFGALPTTEQNFGALVRDFFGLTPQECSNLFPQLQNVNLDAWNSATPVSTSSLQTPLVQAMGAMLPEETAQHSETVESEVPETATTDAQDYSLDWDCFLNRVLVRLPQIPLVGLEGAAIQTIAALKSGKYVILLGPPGTGKTELANVLCECAVECGIPDFTVATATADWSTFDTIGGYMPSEVDSGHLTFSENVFVESVRTGRWLVIDELNRADIDKAFGELFTLFSGNRVRLPFRVESKPIVLLPPGSSVDEELEHPIFLMQDWRMIGTMNTFDKASLFQLSYAFMRRFAFVEVPVPTPALYVQLLTNKGTSELSQMQPAERAEVISLLCALFASEENWSLPRIGALVGPSIPLDMLRYIKERFDIDSKREVTTEPKTAVLEAIEMYFYPQLEGRNELHAQAVNAVATALQLDPASRATTSRILSNWTGAEELNQ
jgi:MoxR-like ATPase